MTTVFVLANVYIAVLLESSLWTSTIRLRTANQQRSDLTSVIRRSHVWGSYWRTWAHAGVTSSRKETREGTRLVPCPVKANRSQQLLCNLN